MRSAGLIFVLATGSLFGLACNQSSTERPQSPVGTSTSPATAATPLLDELASARATFKENCAKCHQETGAGGRVEVAGKEIRVPNLTGEHARKPSDEKLAAKIAAGEDAMPSFKDKLTPEQINELVRFIRKEFQGQ